MTELHSIDFRELAVPPDRQRQVVDGPSVVELSDSIARIGLIHPIVIQTLDGKPTLIAGYRRLKALEFLWAKGQEVKCGTRQFPDSFVPCIYFGELDPVDAYEIELEENIRREDLSWQDRSRAIAKLNELRTVRLGRAPTTPELTESAGLSGDSGGTREDVRAHLLVASYLDDQEVNSAPTARDALKIIKRREALARTAELGAAVGKTYGAHSHTLIKGDCLDIMRTLPSEFFDVILTDPPYGIGADDFGNSGGKAAGAHFYGDNYDKWSEMVAELAIHLYRVSRMQNHAYVFCDIDNFHELAQRMEGVGFSVFRTPIIWVNPTSMRAPWPEAGPQRKWQMILYAVKGKKTCTKLYSDVITVPSDVNLNHQAQKPVALYTELLKRSVRPGDHVIDPFCGTGTIFPAAHEFKCYATGIEIDPSAYGIAVERLNALK
jgi:DNA modification methylase